MGVAVGIDLGTTNSAVAHVDEYGFPVVISNVLGQPTTPSVICFREREVVIGQEAKELQAAGEPNIAAFFKRYMGDESFVFHALGKDHSPTDLSALLLSKLKTDAENILGERVTDAVVTVPAYFRNPEREATRKAAEKAGLNVLQLINEPTAAAIAYGAKEISKKGHLLVCDLGGGTFDVTLCRLDDGEIRILTSTGDHQLGGKDWDDRIAGFVAGEFQAEFAINPLSDSVSVADLTATGEEVKKRLSATQSARTSLVCEGRKGTYDLTRAHFEELTQDLVQRTISLAQFALNEANFLPSALDHILLVGGSTRMPMIQTAVRQSLEKPLMSGVNVDEAVALGAAIVAAEAGKVAPRLRGSVAKIRAADVTNHSLGMIALNNTRTGYVNSIILPKNRTIPCAETRPYRFRTSAHGDNRLEIFVTQGESDSPEDVTFVEKYVVTGFPHRDAADILLDIEYEYDASGTVKVRGHVHDSNLPLAISSEALPDDLPDRFLGIPEPDYSPEPATVYIAIDLSGSMSGAPLRHAQAAAEGFLEKLSLDVCSVGVLAVADRVSTKLKACSSAGDITRAIRELTIGEVGGGNDADPFDEAYSLLSGIPGRRFLIVLADGVWADQAGATKRARRCHAAGVEVIAIGFGSADEAFLRSLATSDEGSLLTSMEGLNETFGSIAQAISGSSSAIEARSILGRLRGR